MESVKEGVLEVRFGEAIVCVHPDATFLLTGGSHLSLHLRCAREHLFPLHRVLSAITSSLRQLTFGSMGLTENALEF